MNDVPFFLEIKGSTLFPKKGYKVIFFIPEKYFDSKNITTQDGLYLNTIGIFLYNVYKDNKPIYKDNKLFYYPTLFTCKPDLINKVNDLKLYKDDTYREVIFETSNSEVVNSIHTIKNAVTAENVLKMLLYGRIPKIIPYEDLYKLINDSALLNGISFNNIAGLEGIIVSELCRNKDDISQQFIKKYESDPKVKNTDYTFLNIDAIPKYVSAYSSLISHDKTIAIAAALEANKINDATAMEKILIGQY